MCDSSTKQTIPVLCASLESIVAGVKSSLSVHPRAHPQSLISPRTRSNCKKHDIQTTKEAQQHDKRAMQAVGASNCPLYVTLRWWPSPSVRAGPQAQWGRGQERITHCSLTPVHKGAPRLEGVRGIPKQPLVQSQTPTTRRERP